ncbi:MAG: hypothetical protein ACREE7_10495 [Dongiaceae bacterium]
MNPRDILLATFPPVLWGVGFTFAKPAVEHFPPLFMIAIVYAVTALALLRPGKGCRTPLWALCLAIVVRIPSPANVPASE